jgi:hypothetical protein
MIHGVSQLSSAVGVTLLPTRPVNAATSTAAVPVILRVTQAEAIGARMRVGGLRVVDRAIRLLARLRDARVVVATDGSVPLPRHLPRNIERRELEGETKAALAALARELGPETTTVTADTVWVQAGRFDRGVKVVDAESRRLATDLVFEDLQRDTLGIVDRLLNYKISSRLTRMLFAHLPISPALITLLAGFVGLYGAVMVASGNWQTIVLGFVGLQGYAVLSGCAGELARLRLHQTAFGAWLDTVVGDFISIVMVLAVGLSLWRHGGSYLDMKMALAAAAMTLLYVAIAYRELMRQGEGDVLKLRWWFAYGQSFRSVSGAGSQSIKVMMLLGRRDFVIFTGLALAYFDQLPIVMLYALIVAIARAGGAVGQLLTPHWKLRPPV